MRTLYLLENTPGKEQKGQSNIIMTLLKIERSNIPQRRPFASPVSYLSPDRQGLLEVRERLLPLAQRVVHSAQVVERSAFTLAIFSFFIYLERPFIVPNSLFFLPKHLVSPAQIVVD